MESDIQQLAKLNQPRLVSHREKQHILDMGSESVMAHHIYELNTDIKTAKKKKKF